MNISSLLEFVPTNLIWFQLGCVALILVCLALLSDSKKIAAKLARALPSYIPRDKTQLVYKLTEADLSKGLRGIKHAVPCIGYFTSERIVLACGDDELHKFTCQDTTMTLIASEGLSSQVPLLIRFNQDGEHLYIACKKRFLNGWDNAKTETLFSSLSSRYTVHTLEQFKDLHRPNRYVVGALFLICLAGISLMAINLFSDVMREAPQVLTQLDDGHVIAFSRTKLYELTGEGDLLSTVGLTTLGLDGGVSDAVPTKAGELLVADSATGLIRRCQRDPWACESLKGSNSGERTSALNAFAIAQHPHNGQLFVADSGRHRVISLTPEGEYLDTVLDVDQLCFPNKVWIENDRLFVVNTNWHSLLEYQLGSWDEPVNRWSTVKEGRQRVNCPHPDDTFSLKYFHRETSGAEKAIVHDNQTEGSVWPMDAVHDAQGNWWVLNAKNGMKNADLVKLSASGELLKVALTGTDPIGLLARDDDVLVADMAHPRILQVLNGGEYFNEFGDYHFQTIMSDIAGQREMQRTYYLSGVALIALSLLLACLLLLFQSDQRLRWIPTA